jgi:hypothetical protein
MNENIKQFLEKGLKTNSKTIEVCELIEEGIISPHEIFYFLKTHSPLWN